MDTLNNLLQLAIAFLISTKLGLGITIFVGHFVLGLVLYAISNYFWGWEVAHRVQRVWFIIHEIVILFVRKVLYVLATPFRSRNRRLFKETFRFDAPNSYEMRQASEAAVNAELAYLARTYKSCIDTQEDLVARRVTDQKQHDDAKRTLTFWKNQFWNAHGLAKKFGFVVKPRYADYLS